METVTTPAPGKSKTKQVSSGSSYLTGGQSAGEASFSQ